MSANRFQKAGNKRLRTSITELAAIPLLSPMAMTATHAGAILNCSQQAQKLQRVLMSLATSVTA